MSGAFLIALAAFLLEHEDFVRPAAVIHDSSLDHGAFNIRCTDLDITVIVYEKHLAELDHRALFLRKAVDENLSASFNLELLACNFYDCVHKTLKL